MAGQELSQEEIRDFVIASHFNLPKVKGVLAEHPDLLNYRFQWGENDFETPVQAAGHVGNREIAEYLLGLGAQLDICVAAMLARKDDVEGFLKEDPTLANATGAHNITVLFHTALGGSTEIAELLVQYGGGKQGLNHAVQAAVMYGHIDMLRWLLEHGVTDVNVPNYQQKTPLAMALENENEDIAALLREHGGHE